MNWITEHNRDNVCDIVWWLKGYMAACKDNYENCPFTDDHSRTLTEIAQGMRDLMDNEEKPNTQRLRMKPLNIYLFIEDYDNSELSEYDRLEQLREAVKVYNYQYDTEYMPDSTVQRYERMKRQNIFGDE